MDAKRLEETVKRLRADIYHCRQIGRVDAFVTLSDLDTILDAADMLCRLERIAEDDAYITVGSALHLAEERRAQENKLIPGPRVIFGFFKRLLLEEVAAYGPHDGAPDVWIPEAQTSDAVALAEMGLVRIEVREGRTFAVATESGMVEAARREQAREGGGSDGK